MTVTGAIPICPSAALVDKGDGVRFEAALGGVRESAFAIRFQGRVHAYVNRCAHIAYELDFQPGKFFDADALYLICSTHGALYEPESGRCVAGPCKGRALKRVPLLERDGQVFAIAEAT
jgi:nitrite reductase/ring-hydroxylating ferredoxin subunit